MSKLTLALLYPSCNELRATWQYWERRQENERKRERAVLGFLAHTPVLQCFEPVRLINSWNCIPARFSFLTFNSLVSTIEINLIKCVFSFCPCRSKSGSKTAGRSTSGSSKSKSRCSNRENRHLPRVLAAAAGIIAAEEAIIRIPTDLQSSEGIIPITPWRLNQITVVTPT